MIHRGQKLFDFKNRPDIRKQPVTIIMTAVLQYGGRPYTYTEACNYPHLFSRKFKAIANIIKPTSGQTHTLV
ncbi:TPA_asm: hypothetical protein G0G78_25935 [Salmonella enterica]|nr:hypothetical protein [Salmonella enterica]EAO7619197.1 hypothetical protein [Salmonella enterica]EAQ6819865.1 hypothetical protein [Salmonella enterica]EAU9427206.1 hypothetical protein [Salmonella enterica]MIV19330.1 hypothetical protein [Salmonella enterica]